MYICVCVIPLLYCTFSWQILMPQPILIAPRGPHRFIPSGEGASPSPFGPLNARGCVRQPPCGGPPWPPLLPGPRKPKNQRRSTRFLSCQNYFLENVSPICFVHIRLPQALSEFCGLVFQEIKKERGVTLFSRKFLGHVLCIYACDSSEFFFFF